MANTGREAGDSDMLLTNTLETYTESVAKWLSSSLFRQPLIIRGDVRAIAFGEI